jgi:glycosyltransferase involved in cell wall biosynthesis
LDTELKISVIIPAYNCEKYIQKCLNSILAQSHQNIEILIADDGSEDRTRKLIDGYSDERIKRFHNNENIGNVRTRNKLFKEATGSYYCIQDADDWSDPDRLKKQISFIQKNNLDGCLCGIKMIKDDRVVAHQEKHHFMPATIMISEAAYKTSGGIPVLLERIIAEDNYWLNRIKEKFNIGKLDEQLYFHRSNPSSLTNSFKLENLTAIPLIAELNRQRKESGSDWVEQNKVTEIKAFKEKLLSNKKWLSNKLMEKAVSIVEHNPAQAEELKVEAHKLIGSKLYFKKVYWVYKKLSFK